MSLHGQLNRTSQLIFHLQCGVKILSKQSFYSSSVMLRLYSTLDHFYSHLNDTVLVLRHKTFGPLFKY